MESFEKRSAAPEKPTYRFSDLPKALALVGGILIHSPSIEAKDVSSPKQNSHVIDANKRFTAQEPVKSIPNSKKEGAEKPRSGEITFEIKLPSDIRADLEKVIWHALQENAAKEISRDDLYHCHVLLSKRNFHENYSPSAYRGTLSNLIHSIVNDYAALLCHSQEVKNKSRGLDLKKRNILIRRGEKPEIIDPAEEPPYTKIGSDLDYYERLTLYFDIDPEGSEGDAELPDGTRLKVSVPSAQHLITSKVTVDIPYDEEKIITGSTEKK